MISFRNTKFFAFFAAAVTIAGCTGPTRTASTSHSEIFKSSTAMYVGADKHFQATTSAGAFGTSGGSYGNSSLNLGN